MLTGFGIGLGPWAAPHGRAPYVGIVATRCRIAHRFVAGLNDLTSRTAHFATDDITQIKLLFWNGFVDEVIINGSGGGTYAERGTGGSQTRSAVVRYPLGTVNRIQVGGVNTWTETNNQLLESDWKTLTTPIPRGQKFFVEQHVHNALGVAYLSAVGNNEMNTALGDQLSFDSADKTGTTWSDGSFGGATFGCADGYGLFPLAILGRTRRGSVMVISNSIGEGIYDTVDASGNLGHICRPLGAAGIGYLDMSVSGDSIERFIASHAVRAALKQYVTHVFLDAPGNDSQAGGEAAIEANIQTALGYFAGKRRVMATAMPRTTGAWTLVNQTDQTIGKDFETIGTNPYIRAKPPNVDAVLDVASIVASGTRGNRYWNADGTAKKWCEDGTHPKQFAYQQIQASGIVAASAFT